MGIQMQLMLQDMPKLGWIGIDVGGTKTRFDLFDDTFNVVYSIKIKTKKDLESFKNSLTTSVRRLLKKTGSELVVAGTGIGFAGVVDAKGIVRSAPNLSFLKDFSFKKVLTPIGTGRIAVWNDLHAAMYGELKMGAAVGCSDALGIFIGTGIGGAIVSNGKLHLGATGLAGDIGHYMLQPFGPLAGSERHGVLDEVASRSAIAGAAASLAVKGWAPHLLRDAGTDVQKIKSSHLAAAIDAGDKAVEELVRSRARIVGIVLSNLVDFFNPEMVVLGGGLTEAMPKIIRDEVAAGIKEHTTTQSRRGLRVVAAKLKGHAVTTGAAKLASEVVHETKSS
ncbi:MAG TPA: ROK family protein [Terriglobia bacterium]|nr:ROK family protein [Terriglobia bacterium]